MELKLIEAILKAAEGGNILVTLSLVLNVYTGWLFWLERKERIQLWKEYVAYIQASDKSKAEMMKEITSVLTKLNVTLEIINERTKRQ